MSIEEALLGTDGEFDRCATGDTLAATSGKYTKFIWVWEKYQYFGNYEIQYNKTADANMTAPNTTNHSSGLFKWGDRTDVPFYIGEVKAIDLVEFVNCALLYLLSRLVQAAKISGRVCAPAVGPALAY